MAYESPIQVEFDSVVKELAEKAAEQFDNEIVWRVMQYNINIDKDELIRALQYDRGQYDKGYQDGKREAFEQIHNKADWQEIKHGEWIFNEHACGYYWNGFICSICGFPNSKEDCYCPTCGARMDGDKK